MEYKENHSDLVGLRSGRVWEPLLLGVRPVAGCVRAAGWAPWCLLSDVAFLCVHLVVVILGPEKLRPQCDSVLVLGPSSLVLTPAQVGVTGDSDTSVFW